MRRARRMMEIVMAARLLVVAIALFATVAHARPKPDKHPAPAPVVEPEKPWAVGVSADRQQKALALYKEGNGYFEQSQYKDALPKYLEALTFWDHPAIHYNTAVCLINLDRTLEAYEHVVSALRFGEAPLAHDLFVQGQLYQKMLADQVGEIEIECNEPGTQVTLDGEPVLVRPGSIKRRVKVGNHQIVATNKPRFQTETETVSVKGGDDKHVSIVLKVVVAQRTLHRRWARWKPYGVMIAGALVGLASLPMYYEAGQRRVGYETAIDNDCKAGCNVSSLPADAISEDARRKTDVERGVALSVVGGVVVISGFVGVLLNQPRLGPTVTPVIGSDHVGMVISGYW